MGWTGFAALLIIGGAVGVLADVGYGVLADVAIGVAFAAIAALLLMCTFALASRLFGRIERHLGYPAAGTLAAAVLLLTMVAWGVGMVLAAAIVLGSLFVAVGAVLLTRRPRAVVGGAVALSIGIYLLAGPAYWWFTPGDAEDPAAGLVRPFEADGTAYARLLERGPHEVAFLTYGSGTDRLRDDYADAVSFTTEPVDGSIMLEEGWQGWRGRLRDILWGFSRDALPLNARVWHPEALDGPLPLVLIVHGNAHMLHESDRGYAYIAEHLASRGFIVASVDENFLNSGPLLYGGVHPENDARAWLLLEHLAQWRRWNAEEAHPFHGRVDFDRVALIGHSRGGEAVYLAGVFNRLAHYPDDAQVTFDYDFGIRAIVAIAPVDGQFRPSGKAPELEDVSFFTIHGGHDGDAAFFHGDRQYQRAKPSAAQGQFKASLYVHHANHGQFNTVWGRRDAYGPGGRALNTRPIMAPEAQRKVALAYFTGFVEAALEEAGAPDPMFCDPAVMGATLPADIYLARCDDGARAMLADFENGLDLTRGTDPGIRLDGDALALWKEARIPLRLRDRERTGLWLGWRGEDAEPGGYTVSWDPATAGELGIGPGSVFWLELAHADQDPPARGEGDDPDEQEANDETNGLRTRAALIVELTDAAGNTASRPLSDFHDLLPPLPVQHFRTDPILPGLRFLNPHGLLKGTFSYMKPTEPLFHSVAIPVQAFAGGGVDLGSLVSLRLTMAARPDAAVVIVDEIAVR